MNRATAGLSIHEGIFDRRRMLEMILPLDRAGLTRTRAGARRLMAVTAVRALAAGPSMRAIAREYLGGDAFPFRASLVDKSVASNWLVTWHQDTALPI